MWFKYCLFFTWQSFSLNVWKWQQTVFTDKGFWKSSIVDAVILQIQVCFQSSAVWGPEDHEHPVLVFILVSYIQKFLMIVWNTNDILFYRQWNLQILWKHTLRNIILKLLHNFQVQSVIERVTLPHLHSKRLSLSGMFFYTCGKNIPSPKRTQYKRTGNIIRLHKRLYCQHKVTRKTQISV